MLITLFIKEPFLKALNEYFTQIPMFFFHHLLLLVLFQTCLTEQCHQCFFCFVLFFFIHSMKVYSSNIGF